MGIKGIYKEIGPGERISLCKLAVEQLEQTGRPLRIAIDISIWQFQVQAAKGGANPAVRTLFYRLVRLLGHAIQPLFVFDGRNKPAFKRGKRSRGQGDMVSTTMMKRSIRLFGFSIHDAPGEAEAECALLQQQGVVDAVLSEDVDTIMFGCRRTLRGWTSEGTKGSKIPTHVSLYDTAELAKGESGLDREGMVLVALMSGGDYIPEGVPGCGIKVACEAARAGFGRDLCRIKRSDKQALAAWKARLLHELRSNESGFFRTKHKALKIPDDFPNMEVLGYYTHPVVSRQATVDRLKREFPSAVAIDVAGLRGFVSETFDWTSLAGAVKLIRVLAPSLLVQLLLERQESQETQDDHVLKQEESTLVKSIFKSRSHFSTDATPELRVSFIPADIVRLDLSAEIVEEVEAYGRTGIALNDDEEFDDETIDDQQESGGSKKTFDPLQPDLVWIPESVTKLGIPLTVETWEEKQRAKDAKAAAQAAAKAAKAAKTTTAKTTRTSGKVRAAKKTDMPAGALDKFVKVTRNITADAPRKSAPLIVDSLASNSIPAPRSSPGIGSHPVAHPTPNEASEQPAPKPSRKSQQPNKSSKDRAGKPAAGANPWTLSGSQVSPKVTRLISTSAVASKSQPRSSVEPIIISSSPAVPEVASPLRSSAGNPEQTSPTRKWSLSPPPEYSLMAHPLSPSPITRKLMEVPAVPSSPQPARKARPFKRAKSGADENTGTRSTQTSITSYGRLLKGVENTYRNDKAATPNNILPAGKLGTSADGEESPLPHPTKKFSGSRVDNSHRSPRPILDIGKDFRFSDDDDDDDGDENDPFGSPLALPGLPSFLRPKDSSRPQSWNGRAQQQSLPTVISATSAAATIGGGKIWSQNGDMGVIDLTDD
ncbi:nuclease-like protein [Podospora didyma]|uniref:Nuclease-like protein n=1 Tax=Podospora didyma TaxID=330526 RepID=A0AAE0NTK5_9PEZI|nr:nuclease-like protein [Podospora didyma]